MRKQTISAGHERSPGPSPEWFERVTDGVVALGPDRSILYSNPAARRILELAAPVPGEKFDCSGICGLSPHPEAAGPDRGCPLDRAMKERRAVTIETPFTARDKTRMLRVRCAPCAGSAATVLHLEDYQETLDQERARRDWRDMIAHDFRSPLGAITSALSILERDGGADLPEFVARLIELSLKAAKRIESGIDQYMALTRMEGRAPVAARETFTLVPAVRAALRDAAPAAALRRVELSPGTLDEIEVVADRGLLGRVVQNLLDNAVKFTDEHGRVSIGVEASGSSWARVTVRDTGIGIAAEDLPKVFDWLYRARGGLDASARGAGIGLTFCRKAVEMMGGRIGASSRPGRGTTVWIELPRAGQRDRPVTSRLHAGSPRRDAADGPAPESS